jgi:hypothetical protein
LWPIAADHGHKEKPNMMNPAAEGEAAGRAENIARQMLAKYDALRAEGWSHNAALLDVIKGRRNQQAKEMFGQILSTREAA